MSNKAIAVCMWTSLLDWGHSKPGIFVCSCNKSCVDYTISLGSLKSWKKIDSWPSLNILAEAGTNTPHKNPLTINPFIYLFGKLTANLFQSKHREEHPLTLTFTPMDNSGGSANPALDYEAPNSPLESTTHHYITIVYCVSYLQSPAKNTANVHSQSCSFLNVWRLLYQITNLE